MAHLPLIMSPKGGKLSKRNADALGIPVNVRDYIEQQYEPDALVNFLAYLGWSPGDDRELLTLDELIEAFSLDRVSKSGAVFNPKKLLWYNEQYLKNKEEVDLLPRVRDHAALEGYHGYSDEFLTNVIRLMKDRAQKISDFIDEGSYFFEAPQTFDEKSVKKAWKQDTGSLITEYRDRLGKLGSHDWNSGRLKEEMSALLEEKGLGFGKLAFPARLAISGVGYGPELFDLMELLGQDEVVARLDYAVKRLG
jgi:glutamyl-tRNA synthetase